MVRGVGALAVAILIGVVIGIAGGGTQPDPRCVNVSFASTLGVQAITRCGTAAVNTCESIGTPDGYTGRVAGLITAECHRLKLKIG